MQYFSYIIKSSFKLCCTHDLSFKHKYLLSMTFNRVRKQDPVHEIEVLAGAR